MRSERKSETSIDFKNEGEAKGEEIKSSGDWKGGRNEIILIYYIFGKSWNVESIN